MERGGEKPLCTQENNKKYRGECEKSQRKNTTGLVLSSPRRLRRSQGKTETIPSVVGGGKRSNWTELLRGTKKNKKTEGGMTQVSLWNLNVNTLWKCQEIVREKGLCVLDHRN